MTGALNTSNPSKPSTANKPIVLLGASYAAGLKLYTINGRRMINKGVGGEQSFEMLARFDADVLAHQPDTVIIWGFINDIFRADQTKMDEAVNRVKASYIAMIRKARQNGITPVLATEITMSMRPGIKETLLGWVAQLMGKTSYQEKINGHVMGVNSWLKTYASQNNLTLLDFQVLLSEGGTLRKKIYAQKDGSHVSEKGYQIIGDFISDHI